MRLQGRVGVAMIAAMAVCLGGGSSVSRGKDKVTVKLPAPNHESTTSIERALRLRRSVRDFAWFPLSLKEIGQLVWAAQGITQSSGGLRTAPSAGALYPLELYVVVGNVEELERGVYRYIPLNHELAMVDDRDLRAELSHAALDQEAVRDAPAVFVFTGVVRRTAAKYGNRASRYMYMEAGHAAENVFLQAVSLSVGTAVIGAFDDDAVRDVMKLSKDESPLYLMPIGKPGARNQ